MPNVKLVFVLLVATCMAAPNPAYLWFKQQLLQQRLQQFEQFEQDLVIQHSEDGDARSPHRGWWDDPRVLGGPDNKEWYVSKITVCYGRYFFATIQAFVTNARTGEKKTLPPHGVTQPANNCVTKSFNGCINNVAVAYRGSKKGKEAGINGLKLWTRDGKVVEFNQGQANYFPAKKLGNQCLSGFYGKCAQIYKWQYGTIRSLGIYSNELYQKAAGISKITGRWERVASGEMINVELKRTVVDSRGNTITKGQSSSLTISRSVEVGFSFGVFGSKTETKYTRSRSQTDSNYASNAVSTQLQKGIEFSCGNSCPQRGEDIRTNLYQWVWDLQTNSQLGNLDAKTCDYVCNTNIRKPPQCQPEDCMNGQCTVCY